MKQAQTIFFWAKTPRNVANEEGKMDLTMLAEALLDLMLREIEKEERHDDNT